MSSVQQKFSKREKFMIGVLGLIIVFLLWYQFIFVDTTNKISSIDSQISAIEDENTAATTKIAQMKKMKSKIKTYKAQGKSKVKVPKYDNITALTARLNTILSSTSNYSIAFDDVKTSSEIVERGADISFGCTNITTARKIMTQLENNSYACSITTATINDSSATSTQTSTGYTNSTAASATVNVSIHAIFYESIS